MTDQTTTPKTRVITLTDRPPVHIREDQWPVIARGDGDSWTGTIDPARHNQALGRGELAEYTLRVRQHADGRAIVYGVSTPDWHGGEDWRGGELLDAGTDIAAAIRRVGESAPDGMMPDRVIRECIADLPAEEL